MKAYRWGQGWLQRKRQMSTTISCGAVTKPVLSGKVEPKYRKSESRDQGLGKGQPAPGVQGQGTMAEAEIATRKMEVGFRWSDHVLA